MNPSGDPVAESVFVDVNTDADDGVGCSVTKTVGYVSENSSEYCGRCNSPEENKVEVYQELPETIFVKKEVDFDFEVTEEVLSPIVFDERISATEGDIEIKSECQSPKLEPEVIFPVSNSCDDFDGHSEEVTISDVLGESVGCNIETAHPGNDHSNGIQSPEMFAVNQLKILTRQTRASTLQNTSRFVGSDKEDSKRSTSHGPVRSNGATKCSYQCSTCNQSYTDKRLFRAHILIHLPFSCDVCLQMFATKAALRKHSECHMYDQSYTCSVCERSYISKDILKKHILASHHNKTPFACTICGLSFAERGSLEEHIISHSRDRISHPPEQLFLCAHCDRSFRLKSQMKRHIEVVHDVEAARYSCNDCDQVFRRKGPLRKHVKTHYREPYSCTYCREAFVNTTTLKNHVLNHLILKSICHFKAKFSNISQKLLKPEDS